MTTPFTYHICWTKQNLHYYGVKFAKGCHPNDLWNPYKTSSKVVKALLESIGEPDIIEVRKIFNTQEKAAEWESRVLKRLHITQRNGWINECVFPSYNWTGRKQTDDHKQNVSKAKTGVKREPFSEEWKRKLSEASKGENNPNFGKTHSPETRQKISNANTGEKHWNYGKSIPEETRKKISNAKVGIKREPFSEEWKKKLQIANSGKNNGMYGKNHSDETRKKMSESKKEYWRQRKINK